MAITLKKALSLILFLSFLISALSPLSAFAEEDEHIHNGTLEEICLENRDGIDFCGKFYCADCKSYYYAPVTSQDIGIPLINITGDMSGVTKETEGAVSIAYSSDSVNFVSNATIKWQGSTSIDYPKKNYNIKLYKEDGSKNKIKIVDDWGKQFKYCLKANWIDASQSRNVVSAKIFNEIVHSRNKDDELDALDNGGAVDGFPVCVYENGVFHGLYTFNIPKDKWAWGMSDENLRQGLLFAGAWSSSVKLEKTISDPAKPEDDGWDIEYCSTEDNPEVGTEWLIESMNNFITFLREANTREKFREGIGKYCDVDRAIDVLLYTYFIHGDDNTAKNIMWATYDGTTWIPCMYDMDATWGMFWEGSLNRSYEDFTPHYDNLLFHRLLDYYMTEITERYVELRYNVLSKRYIEYYFSSFINSIPEAVKTAEHEKWPDVPSYDSNTLEQIVNYANGRITTFDKYFGVSSIREYTRVANKCFFKTDGNVKVFVYTDPAFNGDGKESDYAYTVNDAGALSRSNPRICFRLEAADGYSLADIKIEGGTGKETIEYPDTTGVENCYRIMGVTTFETFRITTQKNEDEPEEGYKVTFDCRNGKIKVFEGSDYTAEATEATVTESLDSGTLKPTKSGDGQVNFEIVPDDGYLLKRFITNLCV